MDEKIDKQKKISGKNIILLIIILLAGFGLYCFAHFAYVASTTAHYNKKDIIGKRSDVILSEYGDFDFSTGRIDADGLYRNCKCGYTIKEKKTGFLGSSDEVLLFIIFDENGIAVQCEEGYRPGG